MPLMFAVHSGKCTKGSDPKLLMGQQEVSPLGSVSAVFDMVAEEVQSLWGI
jgi:hypothetical protein